MKTPLGTDEHEAWLQRQRALLYEAELNLTGRTIHYAEVERVGRWLHHVRLCHRPPAIQKPDGTYTWAIDTETVRLGGYVFGRRRAERKAERWVARAYRRDALRVDQP